MNGGGTPIRTAEFKKNPQEAINIAYSVCEKYWNEGCPEVNDLNWEEDNWYTEGALSGGEVKYSVTGLSDSNAPKYEYAGGCDHIFEDGAEAVLTIRWGRHVLTGPQVIRIRVTYPDKWPPLESDPPLINSIERSFIPAHITHEMVPHLPANQDQIFEWLNEFIDRPQEATAEPGVKFFAGENAADRIKSEILNLLLPDGRIDILSPLWVSRKFQLSYAYAYKLLENLNLDGKIVELDVPERFHEARRLYANPIEWDTRDSFHKDDDLNIRYRG
jgi:hypothetical protein